MQGSSHLRKISISMTDPFDCEEFRVQARRVMNDTIITAVRLLRSGKIKANEETVIWTVRKDQRHRSRMTGCSLPINFSGRPKAEQIQDLYGIGLTADESFLELDRLGERIAKTDIESAMRTLKLDSMRKCVRETCRLSDGGRLPDSNDWIKRQGYHTTQSQQCADVRYKVLRLYYTYMYICTQFMGNGSVRTARQLKGQFLKHGAQKQHCRIPNPRPRLPRDVCLCKKIVRTAKVSSRIQLI